MFTAIWAEAGNNITVTSHGNNKSHLSGLTDGFVVLHFCHSGERGIYIRQVCDLYVYRSLHRRDDNIANILSAMSNNTLADLTVKYPDQDIHRRVG